MAVHPVETPFAKQREHYRQHSVPQPARERAQFTLLAGFILVSPRTDLCGAQAPGTFEFRKYRFELT